MIVCKKKTGIPVFYSGSAFIPFFAGSGDSAC